MITLHSIHAAIIENEQKNIQKLIVYLVENFVMTFSSTNKQKYFKTEYFRNTNCE